MRKYKWPKLNLRIGIELAGFPDFSEDKRTDTRLTISQSLPKLMSWIAGVDAEVLATAQRESAAFGDLLLLDCEEGYGRGRSRGPNDSKVVGGCILFKPLLIVSGAPPPNLKLLSSHWPHEKKPLHIFCRSLGEESSCCAQNFCASNGAAQALHEGKDSSSLINSGCSFSLCANRWSGILCEEGLEAVCFNQPL